MDHNTFFDTNRNSWNSRVDAHLESKFYDLEGFLTGETSLKSIELELLGNISNKSLLHLQCHFGQDTLSLARMGARVTGVDLSDKAIYSAMELATKTQLQANFICCNVYDLPQHLDQQFDIVFTSYGTITWLPDLNAWAALIQKYLKPGGKFIFVEFHPVVWMFDDNFKTIGYDYFNSGPIIENETGTYADRSAAIKPQSVCWNHSMAEVVTALLDNGLSIKQFQEFDYSPYNCFLNTIEFEPGKFRIEHLPHKIPMVYAIEAIKTKL
jgi:ubiquinone/menaquinone biosynthesis C-methylase UbiE